MKKWILRCMLAVSLLLVICVTVGAIGEEKLPGDAGYGYSYRFVTRDTIEITAYTGYERNVTVPAEIDGYTVVGIAYFGRDEAIGQNPVNVLHLRNLVIPCGFTARYFPCLTSYPLSDNSSRNCS